MLVDISAYLWLLPQTNDTHILISRINGRFAANLLVFPHGEWSVLVFCSVGVSYLHEINLSRLGRLSAEDVPQVLKAILERTPQSPKNDAPLCPRHWRGRMGLGKDEQLELLASHLQ